MELTMQTKLQKQNFTHCVCDHHTKFALYYKLEYNSCFCIDVSGLIGCGYSLSGWSCIATMPLSSRDYL